MYHKNLKRIFKAFTAGISAVIILYLVLSCSGSSVNAFYQPKEIYTVLNNPYMGWAPWAEGGPYAFPHKLVYINETWRNLESEKGSYAFDTLEKKNKFDYWESKDVKIILRINMDYPGQEPHMDIPDWLYREINGEGEKYSVPYGKGFSPNYNNIKLISYHEKLIKALAERFNRDDRIAFIAIGSLGHWGEFHTWQSKRYTIPFPKTKISDQYVQPYLKYFTGKMLMMRRPFEIAAKNRMGLFNDSFGDPSHTYDLFLNYINEGYEDPFTGEKHSAMPDFWKYAPSGGEFADFPGLNYVKNSTIDNTIRQIRDSHISWLGPSFPAYQKPDASIQENINTILKTLGYRFVVESVTYQSTVQCGTPVRIEMQWSNKGVAPFYYPWPLVLTLKDADGNIVTEKTIEEDIRTWLPGKKKVTTDLPLPSGLPSGNYRLFVSILDPATGKPGIDLANTGRQSDGRYYIGDLSIYGRKLFGIFRL